jgi:hypothetical protein
MRKEFGYRFVRRASLLNVIVVGIMLSSFWALSVDAQQPLYLENFNQVAPQGFGDFHNSMARASAWWNGKLYVGTSRDFACQQQEITHLYNPFKPYPPPAQTPPLVCTKDPRDLSMQAEIWRWTPDAGNGTWERVYQSPNSLPIPGTTKFTAPEVGFRDMEIFKEADGTEALYVSGISARIFIPGLPPPTLLRTTDGVNFAPVPQAPGTTLGDLDMEEGITITSFNRIAAFNDRFYAIIGGDFGHGVLYEATHPEQGNNAFVRVSPAGLTFTYAEVFQNRLYLGQGAQPVASNPPYKVVKMDTSTNPYTFTTIVDGTRLPAWNTGKGPKSVATMHAVGNALWVATNQPVELLRINPNDTWDLFLGESRQLTTGGTKYPLTGLGDSFDWFFNVHIHRMQDHDGYLYTASNDLSNVYPLNTVAAVNDLFEKRYGFDVHRTKNGWYLYPVTFGGFQEKDPNGANNFYNFTGRVANTTPYGLFIGTGNNQYGTQIWRATSGNATVLTPAQNLEAEKTSTGVVLSWLASPTATIYHIFKADYAYGFQLGVPFYAGGTTYPKPFTEIGTSTTTDYTDSTSLGLFSHYYVVAEDGSAVQSNPSNVTRVPSLIPVTTFFSLQTTVNEWVVNAELAPALQTQVLTALTQAKTALFSNNFASALTILNTLKGQLAFAGPPNVAPWRVDDAQMLLAKLIRRVTLAQAGKIPSFSVKF